MRWSLNELYDSFESEAYKADSKRILEMISEVNTFAEKELTSAEGAKEKAEKYLRYDETLTKLISKVLSYA
ncbi:MAG: oligoendopeptidase F, partial [Clostridia bacterium]|nr:oligoendopeptidase F [Clostridia bacterium]